MCSRPSVTTSSSPTMSKKTHSGTEIRAGAMEAFVAQKLNDFETGKIGRRKLIEMLTLAATATAAGGAQAQSPDPTLKAQLINHFSYTCPNFREAADWYSKVL